MAVALVPFVLFMSGCNSAQHTGESESTAEPNEAPSDLATSAPVNLEPLTRAEILVAANRAADAVANGAPLPPGNAELTDRTFELTLPLGCAGTGANPWAGWTRDSGGKVVRLIARPEQWGEQPWVKALAPGIKFDAAEGFWIERPWSSSESCPPAWHVAPASQSAGNGQDPARAPHPPLGGSPAAPASPAALVPPRQTLGLVEFFAPDAPRTFQRGKRPYAFTLKSTEQGASGEPRFALRVNGRVSGFADGQPIHCIVEDPGLRPRCLVAVEFGAVAFVDLQSGKTVADWKR